MPKVPLAIYDGCGRIVHQFHFVSEGYEQKTFEVQSGKDGPYRLEYGWPGWPFAPCPISITAYHIETYRITSMSFLVQQYVTTVLTEDTVTKTETVADWFEEPIAIVVIIVAVAVVIIIVLMRRKPKPKQTQLEKYA